MNIFRLAGDLSHVCAIIILLVKIFKSRSCAGISGRTQILFTLVFITRYIDLFTTYINLYNSVMKVLFLTTTATTVYLIYGKFKDSYDRKNDSFHVAFLLIPCVLLSLLVNHDFTAMELLWTFSIYLESVAIVPQMVLICKTGVIENITSYYMITLCSYRAFYILNWIYRYQVEDHYDLIAICAGIVQTVLYFFFTCIYRRVKADKDFQTSRDLLKVFDKHMNLCENELNKNNMKNKEMGKPVEKQPLNSFILNTADLLSPAAMEEDVPRIHIPNVTPQSSAQDFEKTSPNRMA